MENRTETSFLNTEGEAFPVITLYQPWASWIMRGWKTIETRTHNRFGSLFGLHVLIHAGQRTDDSDYAIRNPYLTKEQILLNPDEVVNGAILGKVFVYNFCSLDDAHSKRALIECKETKRWGLFLSDIEVFKEPIPCKGEMGIWYYDVVKQMKVKKPSAVGVFKKDEHQTTLWK